MDNDNAVLTLTLFFVVVLQLPFVIIGVVYLSIGFCPQLQYSKSSSYNAVSVFSLIFFKKLKDTKK